MSVSRLENGLSTAHELAPLGQFILPDPRSVHQYFDDFDTYTAADWTVTEVGVATQALEDADGGRLLITNAAGIADSSFSDKVGESFLFATGKKLWFDCSFQVSDATESVVVFGVQITDTTPAAVSDGVFFLKADGAATVDFIVTKNTTPTTESAIATMSDDTDMRLSFYYDGKTSIKYFVDGVQVGTAVTTNMPDDEIMTVSYGIQNGEAVAKTMSIDWVLVAKER